MAALDNPRHEAFAQALAKGRSATDAYADAGYKPDRKNAARLTTNDGVMTRVAELTAKAAQKTVDTISFNAVDQFNRMQDLIDKAIAAGDLKTALDGQKFIAQCFGYHDSPTLTHEHVAGRKLPVEKPAEGGDAPAPMVAVVDSRNMAAALDALRRRSH